MDSDAKAIIGTIVGTGLVVAGLLSAQVAGLNTRIDDLRADVYRIEDRMDRLEVRVEQIDTRLDAVEVALGRIDQRLLTIERVVLPSAAPGEQAST